MKALTNVEQNKGTPPIAPFNVDQCLAGIDFNDAADALLEYLDFFTAHVPFGALRFLHVLSSPDLFNIDGESDAMDFVGTEVEKEVADKLKTVVGQGLKSLDPARVAIEVREGAPLEQLLEAAASIRADLVAIGQSAARKNHGILMKNFARQVGCNALVVPSHAKPRLKKILVPVDFSEDSAKALRAAIAINKLQENPAKISVLHAFHLPANFSAYRFNERKVMEMLEQDRDYALRLFISENVPEDDLDRLKPVLLEHNRQSIGRHIAGYAENNKFDLVVIGATGHSKVAMLLMGSVTEKVLSTIEKVPVLVMK